MKTFPLSSLLLALLLGTSCSETPDGPSVQAVAKLQSFKVCVAKGDKAGMIPLLSLESRNIVQALPKKGRADQPFEILNSWTRSPSEIHVKVRDPDPEAQNRDGTYVVVKEQGKWRIDLVATAGLNSDEVKLPGPSHRLVQKPMSGVELRNQVRQARRLMEASASRGVAAPAEQGRQR
jgi:hypothetical protein